MFNFVYHVVDKYADKQQDKIKAITYGDNQATMASTEKTLQQIMDRISKVEERYGMRINIDKSKVMKMSKQYGTANIVIGGKKLEQVGSFKYPGSTIKLDGSCTEVITGRIACSKAEFKKLGACSEQRVYQ